VRFPYTKLFLNAQPRPYLNVFLGKGFHTSDVVMALVDSGADYPIFPMDMANSDYLNLDLVKAESWNFSGTTGLMQTAKLAEVWMTILEPDGTKLCEVLTMCAFCDTFKMSGGVLLGQIGFFSCFKTSFYQPEQHFEIEQWPAIAV